MHFRHRTHRLLWTSVVQRHIEEHKGEWLISLIASYQADEEVQKEHFQLWTIRVFNATTAILEMRPDSNKRPMITHEIGYTDYSDFLTEFYVVLDAEIGPVLMLPDEY